MNQEVDATILIVTHNRIEDARRAIQTSLQQIGRIEVLVFDDASTDGTAEMIADQFPQVRLERSPRGVGCIPHRNRGPELARAPIVVSIDDDTSFPDRHTVSQTVAEFSHPRVGAVAIPLYDTADPGVLKQSTPDPGSIWATHQYIGAASAFRKEVFLRTGGHNPLLAHFGFESDLAARFLAAGYITRLGGAPPAFHQLSPNRNRRRERKLAAQDLIVYLGMSAPFPSVVSHLIGVTARESRNAVHYRMPGPTLHGVLAGYRRLFANFSHRAPLPRDVYRLLLRMRAHGPIRFEDVERYLGWAPSDQPPK